MSEKRLFSIGINETIVDKPGQGASVNFATRWQSLKLSVDELIDHVQRGHAFSAHFKESYRKTENFVCSDVVAADVDGTMTLDEALATDFVKDFASFIYTTPSHTSDRHRFRIVFLLEVTIHKSADWSNCLLGLALKIGSDLSIKDAGRMFFGNSEATVHRIGKLLPSKEAESLIAAGLDHRSRSSNKLVQSVPMASSLRIDADRLIRTSSGASIPFKDLPQKTSVYCPFHLDTHASAFVVKSYRGSTGVHCMACNATFWASDPEAYDFDAFDRLVEERSRIDRGRLAKHEGSASFLEQYFPPDATVQILKEQFLPKLDYRPGITMVKSPKGSGKTEALKWLLGQIRSGSFRQDLAQTERPRSILLVGHRQSLIKEAANKLGLTCYLDQHGCEDERDGFATCLDSLYRITESSSPRIGGGSRVSKKSLSYDVLILDESEQVFSHLTADTLAKNRGTFRAYLALSSVVQRAKAIYALDADLGLITAHALKAFRPNDWKDDCRIIFNKPLDAAERRPLSLYKSRADLEQKLIAAVKEGKRCYLVSNSKKAVDTLEELIVRECGEGVARRKITSDNSRNPDEREFVLNIITELPKIQVLLCSPSLGTGIDITFPDGRREVDHVFGFFYSFINTHTDIDQQVSRVRNPGEVSLWFDHARYSYETNFDVIRDDLARGYWVENAVTGTDEDGRVRYDENHPLLLISAHVMCSQRASKSNLVELFRRLREASGWEIKFVDHVKMPKPRKSGWKEAEKSVKDRRAAGVLSAEDLSDDEVIELYEAKRRGEKLTKKQQRQLDRGVLRMTFNVPITPELVEMNADGRLHQRVEQFRAAFDEHVAAATGEITRKLRAKGGSQRLPKMQLGQLVFVVMDLSGLIQGGELDEAARIKKNDLLVFSKFCRDNQTVIEELVGFQIRDDLEKNPVRTLNQFMKLAGLSVVPSRRKRSKGRIDVEYVLEGSKLGAIRSLAAAYRNFESAADRREASERGRE
jgi:hypothetical protein